MTHTEDTIPLGFCQCGCGERTRIAVRSNAPRGWVKGEPMRFVHLHHPRVIKTAKFKPSEIIDRFPNKSWVMVRLTQGKMALVDRDSVHKIDHRSWQAIRHGSTWYTSNATAGGGVHRFLLDCPDGLVIDHINGNPLDNRAANLRVCTRAENARNSRKPKTNTSGYKGVQQTKSGLFWAVVNSGGNPVRIGPFDTAEDAAREYDDAARREFGEYARTNFR